MRYLKDWRIWFLAILSIALAALVGYWFGLAVFVAGLLVWVFGEPV